MAASSTLPAAKRSAVNASGERCAKASLVIVKFAPQMAQTSSIAASYRKRCAREGEGASGCTSAG